MKDQIKTDNVPQSDYITIMHNIFSSDMPESEKAVPRVTEEAYVILVAGTDTTAGTMGVICYHLLTMPCILKKVKEELATVIPDADKLPTCADLVNLPYMVSNPYEHYTSLLTFSRQLLLTKPCVFIPPLCLGPLYLSKLSL